MDLEWLAREVGLDLIAAAPAGPTPHWSAYREWTKLGYAAGMSYLVRPDAVLRRQDPRHILPETKTVLVTAVPYGQGVAPEPRPFTGYISRYAWGEDYHHWLLARLKALVDKITANSDVPVKSRCYVDTGPILERAWAQAAGLGWIGKNTCLINPAHGSYIFLGVILINLELHVPRTGQLPVCGSCSRCLDACPTGALVAPGVLDANLCISYLTIENRGAIPEELRTAVGNRVFGCDTCQDVCPWNAKIITQTQSVEPRRTTLDLREVLEMTSEDLKQRYRSTPIWRAAPEGLARNAAVVLGNQGGPDIADYAHKLAHAHESALVREQLLWATKQSSAEQV